MASVPISELDRDLLELYLNDHLTGATAGRARIRHMVQVYPDLPVHDELRQLAKDLEEEHQPVPPCPPLLEVELLRGAVNAKSGLWECLHDLSPALDLEAAEWQTLADRVRDQDELLRRMHEQLRDQTFARR